MVSAVKDIAKRTELTLRQFNRLKCSTALDCSDLTEFFTKQANHHTHESGNMATAYPEGCAMASHDLYLYFLSSTVIQKQLTLQHA